MNKNNKKSWYKSKTIWYAIITGIGGIVATFATQYPDVGALAFANSIFVLLLRVMTEDGIK